METEQQKIITIPPMHSIVVAEKKQIEGTEGRSYYTYEKLGVVTAINLDRNRVTIKCPNGESEDIDFSYESDKYQYGFAEGSEMEYSKKIEDERKRLLKNIEDKKEELETLLEWQHDFEFKISVLGRMARFIKVFVQK